MPSPWRFGPGLLPGPPRPTYGIVDKRLHSLYNGYVTSVICAAASSTLIWGPRHLKILLTGILSPMIWGMVDRLVREGHQVSLLGHGMAPVPPQARATLHDISPGHADALQVLQAGRFGAIVFFYAYQCEDVMAYGSVQGAMLDALFQLQHTASGCGVERFILITDLRVFGAGQDGRENETALPDTATGILINAAEEVLRCVEPGAMKTLLLRVTNLYCPGYDDAFFARARRSVEANQTFQLTGQPDTVCDFLHVDDLALYITLALDQKSAGVVHLAYGEPFSYEFAVSKLQTALPALQATYLGSAAARPTLQCAAAKLGTAWIPRHRWVSELDTIYARTSLAQGKLTLRRRFGQTLRRLFGSALPWVELILFGAIAEGLSRLSDPSIAFRTIDYWLFYVVLMGYMHGKPIGITAGLVACVGYGAGWALAGNDLYLLLYNNDNWLPLAMYLLAGGAFGYLHDKYTDNLESMRMEKEQRDAETEFIQTMYRQVDADRSSLQEQVMRFRDSYGRIYAITQELDTLQPEQVFLSTLDVLEDVMQNRSVALYSCAPDSSFVRLVVHSRAMDALPRSMDMREYPLMNRMFTTGEIFANTQLEPGYPAFCAALLQEGRTIAMIALWDVPFEQQTLYRQNLFSVVSGLVRSALTRALNYFGSAQDMYIDETHILADKPFRATLGVYSQMRKQRASSYLLLYVTSLDANASLAEFDRRIGRATRSTDIAGQLENGRVYVLLPQASLDNMPQIERRFLSAGLRCAVVS